MRDRIQTNGRCETADAQGDTYGPVAYDAYLPGYLLFGWSGKWDIAPGRARDLDPLGPRSASSGSGWSGGASAGPRLGGDARLRLGGLAVHPVRLELRTATT